MTVIAGFFGDALDVVGDVLKSVPIAGQAFAGGAVQGDVKGGAQAEMALFERSRAVAEGDFNMTAWVPGAGGGPSAAVNPTGVGSPYSWLDPRTYAHLSTAGSGDFRRAAAQSLSATSARAVAAQLAAEAAAVERTRAGASGGAFEPGGVGRTLVGLAVVAGALYLGHRFFVKGAHR